MFIKMRNILDIKVTKLSREWYDFLFPFSLRKWAQCIFFGISMPRETYHIDKLKEQRDSI